MFCPECRAEYRPGFTKCADCGVDLVSRLPEGPADADADVPINSEGLELLWTGVNQPLANRIHDALDAGHIFHKITDNRVGLLATFAQDVQFIWIDPRDRTAARAMLGGVVANAGAADEEDDSLRRELSKDAAKVNPFGFGRKVFNRVSDQNEAVEGDELLEPDDSGEPVPDDTADDPDPDDATSEAWTGADKEMADYLANCLRGVGIGCIVSDENGKARVLVVPAVERRALEIVREVMEGTPPQ